MTLTPEALLAIVGVNSVLGLLGLLGYLYANVKLRAVPGSETISVREAIEGQQIFNSEQVIQILREFKSDDARLNALRELAQVQNKSQDSADRVYRKVKGAVDAVENQKIQLTQIRRAARGVTPVFISLALLSFAYGVATNPDFITAVSNYITPGKPQRVGFQPKVFTHPDVAREGRIFNIKATVTPNASGGGSYNIDFYWTGSGGTWSGQQTAIISFLGAQDQSLQSVSVPIDRSGCFYGGGNHQTSNGALSIAPDLITHISVTLSEVHNRTQGGC